MIETSVPQTIGECLLQTKKVDMDSWLLANNSRNIQIGRDFVCTKDNNLYTVKCTLKFGQSVKEVLLKIRGSSDKETFYENIIEEKALKRPFYLNVHEMIMIRILYEKDVLQEADK